MKENNLAYIEGNKNNNNSNKKKLSRLSNFLEK